MVVDDLDDGHLLQSGNALLRLVVVDEDHPHGRRLRERAFEDGTDEHALLVDNGKMVVRIADGRRTHVVDAVVRREHVPAVVQRRLAHGDGEIRAGDEEGQELRRGEHPHERAVRRTHGQRRLAGFLKRAQCVDERHPRVDHRDVRIDKLPYAHVDVAERANRLEVEVVEHPLRARGKASGANGLDVVHAGPPPEVRERVGARHRVDVRIPMPAYVCRHHSIGPQRWLKKGQKTPPAMPQRLRAGTGPQ